MTLAVAGAALGVDGEGAQALHLVAPELDTQRVAERRVRVDEPAAHGVLAARTYLLDALVAERREMRDDPVERDLEPRRELKRPWLQLEREEALEQGHGLRHDHAARRQGGERLLALADDVRGRRHVGAVEHAARRQHGHVAIEVEREVGGEARRRVAVRRHDQAPWVAGGAQRRRHDVGREVARGVDPRAAAQPRRGPLEGLALHQIIEEHGILSRTADAPYACGGGASARDCTRTPSGKAPESELLSASQAPRPTPRRLPRAARRASTLPVCCRRRRRLARPASTCQPADST